MEVKFTVSQIIHGSEYEGKIEGLSETVKYKLLFGVPINQIDSQVLPEDPNDRMTRAKELFNFSVTKSDIPVETTDELFGFMMGTAGQLVINFYNCSQTQDYAHSNSLVASAIREKEDSFLGKLGVSASIGMATSFDIPEEQLPKVFQ